MTLKLVRNKVYERFLAAQRLYRLIESDVFERAYSKGNQLELIQLIEKGDLNTLRSLVNRLGTEELENKPMMELRKLGQKYGVKNYHTLPKTHLIEGIRDAIRSLENIASDNEKICSDVRDRRVGVSGT